MPTPSLANNSDYFLKTETNRESVATDFVKDGVVASTGRQSDESSNVNETNQQTRDQSQNNNRKYKRRKAISFSKTKKGERHVASTLTVSKRKNNCL